jgi:hypothetical protein
MILPSFSTITAVVRSLAKAVATTSSSAARALRFFSGCAAPASPSGQAMASVAARSGVVRPGTSLGSADATSGPAPGGNCAQPNKGRHTAMRGGISSANLTDTVRVASLIAAGNVVTLS